MELNSTQPIFIQIKDYYENLIDIGALKEGEMMPSVREIALANGVNPNTVQRALTLMVEEGYLTNIPKKGFYVNKVKKNNRKVIKKTISYLYSLGIKRSEILKVLEGDDDNDRD